MYSPHLQDLDETNRLKRCETIFVTQLSTWLHSFLWQCEEAAFLSAGQRQNRQREIRLLGFLDQNAYWLQQPQQLRVQSLIRLHEILHNLFRDMDQDVLDEQAQPQHRPPQDTNMTVREASHALESEIWALLDDDRPHVLPSLLLRAHPGDPLWPKQDIGDFARALLLQSGGIARQWYEPLLREIFGQGIEEIVR